METVSAQREATDDLKYLKAEAEAELERILAFWAQHTVDEEQGGFIGQMENDGTIDQTAPKGSVLNARILWSFSAAYRHTQQEEHRVLAERAYTYLLEHFLDNTHGGIYWSVDAQGQPLETRKQVYAVAFAIYGLTEYYLATQEEQALEVSKQLYTWIEEHSFDTKQGGYLEAFSREGELLEDLRLSEKDRNDPKTMNTHLHVLEAYANLYRVWPDQELAQQLEALLQVFLTRIIDTKKGHMQLFFTQDWTSTADIISYGHDIEASWLLQEAAEVLGKAELLEQVKAVSLEMAKATTAGLQLDGSLYHEYDRESRHCDKHREWWVSAEAMVGFLNAYELTGEKPFLRNSVNAWEFTKKYLLDQEQGEWFWGVHDDYSLMSSEYKIGFWKCPYHNTRACLEVVHRCNRLIA